MILLTNPVNMPELGRFSADAASIGPEPAQFWHVGLFTDVFFFYIKEENVFGVISNFLMISLKKCRIWYLYFYDSGFGTV